MHSNLVRVWKFEFFVVNWKLEELLSYKKVAKFVFNKILSKKDDFDISSQKYCKILSKK